MSDLHHTRARLGIALMVALTPVLVLAQPPPPASTDTTTLDTLIVSGTAAKAVRKLEASFTVVAVNAEQIQMTNPHSTADLMKIAPGIWPEATGGQTGNNIGVAGFPSGCCQPYFSMLLNGSPLYGVPVVSALQTADLFRMDDTIEAMEILQGGPSVVFADGQMGATANFFLKTGTERPSGSIGLTWGNEGLWRLDGFSGFKLSKHWYGSIGGFWRESDGVRDPEFKADKGGQLTATVSRDFDAGRLTLYARHLNDKNQFITPIPLIQRGRDTFSAYPGFDPLTGTYYSNAMRRVRLPTYPGGAIDADLADGRGAKLSMFGGNFEYDFGNGWQISNSFLYNTGDSFFSALFSRGNPATLADTLYNPNVIGWLDVPTSAIVSAHYTTGGVVDMDDSLILQTWRRNFNHFKSFNNDFRLSREIFDNNTLTMGLYLAHYTMDTQISNSNWMLMSNEPNARPVTISYIDGGQVFQRTDTQDFTSFAGAFNRTNYSADGKTTNIAFYLSDSWRVGQWLLDLSGRIERQDARETSCNIGPVNPGTGGLDGDLNTLYDNDVGLCDGSLNRNIYQKTHPTWTAGANYTFANNMSIYARVNTGARFPAMDAIHNGERPPMHSVRNYELGFKYQSSLVYTDLSAYWRVFNGIVYQPTDSLGNQIGENAIYGSETFGINLIGTLNPIGNLNLKLVANYMDGEYTNYAACVPYVDINNNNDCAVIEGKPLQRQPRFRGMLTPNYRFDTSWGSISPWLTYTYVGNHTNDPSGLQQLGSYYYLDFGITAHVGEHWQFNLRGTNITNELGLTEGNARIFGSGVSTDNVVLARPMEGREINFQVKYIW